MSKKLASGFLALVILPLGLLAWFGIRASANDEMRVKQQLRDVLAGRLRDTRGRVVQAIAQIERELQQRFERWEQSQKKLAARATGSSSRNVSASNANTLNANIAPRRVPQRSSNSLIHQKKQAPQQTLQVQSKRRASGRVLKRQALLLRRLQRDVPLVRQAFWLDPKGQMLYPDPELPKDQLFPGEKAFLQRTRVIWERRAILSQPRRMGNLIGDTPTRAGATQPPASKRTIVPKKRPKLRVPKLSSLGNVFGSPRGSAALSARGKAVGKAQRGMAVRAVQRRRPVVRPTSRPSLGSFSQARTQRQYLPQQILRQSSFGRYTSQRSVPSTPLALLQQLSRRRSSGQGDSLVKLAVGRDHGWIVWYWAEGLHLLFWKRQDNGGILGVEVDRIVLMSQLIGSLPGTSSDDSKQPGRVMLVDDKNAPLYQWGIYKAPPKEAPLARLFLRYPLHTWQLVYYGPERQQFSALTRRIHMQMLGLFGVVALLLVLIAFYLVREYSRDMRDAAQRVTFVTQVSHELKTPLTNIRLYAELLEGKIPEEQARSRRHIGVIVSESQRLSRLINNILTFARQQRSKLKLRPGSVPIDPLIRRIAEPFRPQLEAAGFTIELALEAPAATLADADAVEQILGNLISNVKKYASQGQWLALRSWQDDAGTHIEVEDRGPGVKAAMREEIFQPFVRCSDKLSEGVSGTGIGLTIARELAWLLGGELALVEGREGGACFRLTLPLYDAGD